LYNLQVLWRFWFFALATELLHGDTADRPVDEQIFVKSSASSEPAEILCSMPTNVPQADLAVIRRRLPRWGGRWWVSPVWVGLNRAATESAAGMTVRDPDGHAMLLLRGD
jgi:hypothetical protein